MSLLLFVGPHSLAIRIIRLFVVLVLLLFILVMIYELGPEQ